MNRMKLLYLRIVALIRGNQIEHDLDRELRSHLEMLAEKYRASGMPEHEALTAARRRFGNVGHLKERARDVRGSGLLGQIARDTRYEAFDTRPALRSTA